MYYCSKLGSLGVALSAELLVEYGNVIVVLGLIDIPGDELSQIVLGGQLADGEILSLFTRLKGINFIRLNNFN